MRKLHCSKPRITLFFLLLVNLVAVPTQVTSAITQQGLYRDGIFYFNLQDDQDCSSTGSTPGGSTTTGGGANTGDPAYLPDPPGSTNEQKVYAFLVGEAHLTPAGAAGIMGNMQAESGFDYTDEEVKGASWNNMSNQYHYGVGLVQWDGGRRPAMINWANQKHNTDPKGPNGLTVQLNYVWYELNTSYKQLLPVLTTTTDPGDAAFQFHKLYEISADSPDKIQGRINNAKNFFQKYNGTTANLSPTGACSSNNSLAANCQAATGNARIICDAKIYDPVSYSESLIGGHQGGAEWHKSCPTIGPSCYLDCSGLVNIAVYDVYKVDLRENTDSERADIGKYWQQINFDQLKPGDLIQPNSGHVEIVDSVQGSTINTFGAHTDGIAQDKQVGPAVYKQSSGQIYLRYIGPGANG